MYYEYFGLKQPPFRITPDTRLFYPGGNRGAVLEALVYAIGNGEGIVKVVGEVGSGKTMLCRMLEQELPKHVEVVYLANPSLSPEVILHAIAHELKLPQAAGTPRIQVMNALQEYLLRRHGEGRQVVVFVEEAQGIPLETLEEVRLLSNLETGSNKLLQIVLFGQPELDEHMSRREIRQLKERVTYSFHLDPFSRENIAEYLNTRVRACGYRSGELFSAAAIRAIRQFSTGLVRRINILADKALLAAYADNSPTVEARHVRRAARDSEFVPRAAIYRNRIAGGVLAFVAIACAGLALWTLRADVPGGAPALQPAQTVSGGEISNAAAPPAPQPVADASSRADPASAAVPETAHATAAAAAAAVTPSPSMDDAATAQEPDASTLNPESDRSTAGPASALSPAPQPMPEEVPQQPAAGDAGAPAAAGQEPAAVAQATVPEPEATNRLLGMGAVFLFQDWGDARLTTREMSLLQQQLRALPPEVAEQDSMMPQSDGCKMCWSIIYRPLPPSENL